MLKIRIQNMLSSFLCMCLGAFGWSGFVSLCPLDGSNMTNNCFEYILVPVFVLLTCRFSHMACLAGAWNCGPMYLSKPRDMHQLLSIWRFAQVYRQGQGVWYWICECNVNINANINILIHIIINMNTIIHISTNMIVAATITTILTVICTLCPHHMYANMKYIWMIAFEV